MEHNLSKYIREKKHEIIIFVAFFSYFIFWNNLNFNYVKINNNSLSTAIEIYSYVPYASLILDNLFHNVSVKIFLGNIFFPSLVSLALFITDDALAYAYWQ